MIVLGLLLIAASTVFGVELFVSNNNTETVGEAFGQSITHLSAGGYFLLGSATTVSLLFGVLLVDSGLRRMRTRRAEREEFEARQVEAARQAQWERSAAVSEADRLREELVEERMNQATLGGVVPPPDLEADPAQAPAAPVDDPEHAEADHRGVLGRIRGDRPELAEPPAPPPPAPVKATAPKPPKPVKKAAAEAPAAPAPAPAPQTRPQPRAGVTPQPRPARKVTPPPPPAPPAAPVRTEGGTPVPRPESATDAFNAALAPAVNRERPPSD